MSTTRAPYSTLFNGTGAAVPHGALTRISTQQTFVLAQADSSPHLLGYAGANGSGTVGIGGPANIFCIGAEIDVLLETGLTPAPGSTVYVSASVAGRGTTTAPGNPQTVGTIQNASQYALTSLVTVLMAGGGSGGGGFQGAQGATGSQGASGAQGATGAGSQGAQGNTGSQGASGAQGATGAGSQGAQGNTGSQGASGAQGATGAGSQGAQGNTGSQGASGAQGATGAGSQGAQGNTGSQGASGAQGATGVGSQGAQGNTGSQGASGAQGAQGNTGAGTQGAQGASGVQGFQGGSGSGGGAGITIDEAAPYDNPLTFTPIGGQQARVILFQQVYDFDQLGATLSVYLSGVIGRTINNQYGEFGLFILADPDVTPSDLFDSLVPTVSWVYGLGAANTKVKDDNVATGVSNPGGLRQILIAAITGTAASDYAPPDPQTLRFWGCIATIT